MIPWLNRDGTRPVGGRAVRPDNSCPDCWAPLDEEDANAEAFEQTGLLICSECWEASIEADDDIHASHYVRNGSML